MRSNTSILVYFVFLVNHVAAGSVLSTPYALAVLLYAIPESPQPEWRFWAVFLWYTIAIITCKS